MTAFQRYKRYVLRRSIVISVAVAVTISLIFAIMLPTIEKQLPNADSNATAVTEVTNE
ncbi:MAG: hypothetical protein IJ851_02675 [Eubacterium sp.]|nr:hypothetical protein [Eubacterium sp.]